MRRSLTCLALASLALLAACNRAEKEARAEVQQMKARLPITMNPLMKLTKAEVVGQEVRLTVSMDAKLALQVDADKVQKTMRDGTCADEAMRRMSKAMTTKYLVEADGATFHTIVVPKGVCETK